jgi:murein DD-endopeptidase MepM/ murein hydrolase activator NlpD
MNLGESDIWKKGWRSARVLGRAVICLGLSLLLWFLQISAGIAQTQVPTISPLQSGSVEELQRQQQQLEQQRSQLSQQRQRLLYQEKKAQGQLKHLQKSIKATSREIQASETKLQAEIKRLVGLETVLVKAEQDYRQRQYATVARLRFLQRQQLEHGWAVLLQSQNLSEFLDRRRQLKLLYGVDRKMIATLKQATDRIEQKRQQVEQQKNQIALLNQQLLMQKAEYEAQATSQQDMIGRLHTDRRALEAAEVQLAKDSSTIATLIQQRSGRTGVIRRGNGRMVYPCAGEITSNFGFRMHPILGYMKFHAGMDFGADYGSAIFAAESGTVIFAGWYGGYGNAVILDHGGSITTLYGHTSELYVEEGQTVQRGQPIAAVGSTGLSTGPHLHFEVRENGEPVDPIAYL